MNASLMQSGLHQTRIHRAGAAGRDHETAAATASCDRARVSRSTFAMTW
jgi:hypothetical protein